MTEVSHDVKIPTPEPDSKGTLAKGKGVIEAVIKERKPVILSETPGRDASIKPRSPYREPKGEYWNRNSSDRSSEDSVRVNDSNIRSVYEIRGSKGSPNHSTPNTDVRSGFGRSQGQMIPHGAAPGYPPSQFPGLPPGAVPYYFPQGVPPSAIPYPATPAYPTPHHHYPVSASGLVPPPGPPRLLPNAMPDYDSYPEELEKQARLEFMSLFSGLKIQYPDNDFSEYNPDMPLRFIHQTYLDYKRNLAIESNASIIKIVLVFIFFGIDYVSRRYLGFDSSSFTESQLARIKSYNSMINEISAAFVGTGDNNWPVGVRFAFLLLFNTGLWIGVSFLCAKMGIKNPQFILNTVNGVIGNSVDEVVAAKPPPVVNPVTNTTEVPKSDPIRNLMGNANTLLAMAGTALGTKPNANGDLGDAIGTLGSSLLANNVKAKKPNVRFGTKK